MTHFKARGMVGVIAAAFFSGPAFATDFDEFICTRAAADPYKLPNQYGQVIDVGIMGGDVGYMVDTNGDATVDLFVIDRDGDGNTFEEIAYHPAGNSAVRVLSMRDSRCK